MLTNLFGFFNQDVLEYGTTFANLMANCQKLEEALSMLKIIMKLYEKLFGLDNMYTIQTMKDCCSYYFELEKYDKAIQMQLKALYLYDLIGGDLV